MKLPAGKYYVGDLCYVLRLEWEDVCACMVQGNGVFTLPSGKQFAIFVTRRDGSYYDQFGSEYGVDGGNLGCVLFADIDMQHPLVHLDSGNVHEIAHSFDPFVLNGMLNIGHVSIEID